MEKYVCWLIVQKWAQGALGLNDDDKPETFPPFGNHCNKTFTLLRWMVPDSLVLLSPLFDCVKIIFAIL